MTHTAHAHGTVARERGQSAAGQRLDRGADERRLAIAFVLTAGFMIAEFGGGLWTGSLALIADSGHMLNDAFALGLAVFAVRVASRPADSKRSYGYGRVQVLAAFTNAILLIFIAGAICWAAIGRIMAPPEILSGPMLAIAFGGLVVNLIAFVLLRKSNGRNLNIRSALFHVVGDLFGSLAAILAAALILLFGWSVADPVLSIVVAVMIAVSAVAVLWESAHILLEGTPRDLSSETVVAALRAQFPAITDIHHVHIWSLDSEEPLITLHAVLKEGADREAVLGAIQEHLASQFGIVHATIQIEVGSCHLARRPGMLGATC
jgi:cobalt-zinc-cadmium efflux system protein